MPEAKIFKVAIFLTLISLSLMWLSSLNTYVALDDGPSLKLNETQTAIIIDAYLNEDSR